MDALRLAALAALSVCLSPCAARAQLNEGVLAGGGGVALSGQRALVGDRLYQRHAGEWSELVKLEPRDTPLNFGYAVAMQGERIAIGTDPGTVSANAGVYTFSAGPAAAVPTGKLVPSNGAADSGFGLAVALDGDRLAVGAPFDDDHGRDSGSVYLYEHTAAGWTQTAKLVPADGSPGDQFGTAISLKGDRLAIGARSDDDLGQASGSCYLFDFAGGQWTQSAKLLPPNGRVLDFFGWSVALSSTRLLVGAVGDDEQGLNAGAAYLFESASGSWALVKKLVASDGGNGDGFGSSIALSGKYAVIGAYGAKQHGLLSGVAYLYERDAGEWTQVGQILERKPGMLHLFGRAVALDGELALVAGSDATAANLEQTGNTLQAGPAQLSVSAGGQQSMLLNATPAAAQMAYLILGSASGTAPGTSLGGGALIPLNDDAYFQFTLNNPGSAQLPDSQGQLNTTGQALAAYVLPPLADPALIGTTLHHAFAVFDGSAAPPVFASNAVALSFAP